MIPAFDGTSPPPSPFVAVRPKASHAPEANRSVADFEAFPTCNISPFTGKMVGRTGTPAHPKTPTRTLPSRKSKTPSRETEASISPAPSLPTLPTGKLAVVSSSYIPFDPVAVWVALEKDSDVTFSTQNYKTLCQEIGDHFQPYEHCNPLQFPPVARAYGLERWAPTKLQSNRSRGPTCVFAGKPLKCHKSCLPAFMYTSVFPSWQ